MTKNNILTHEIIKNVNNYAFLFDIDGTLTQIKPQPQDVFLQNEVKIALKKLSNNKVAVALISGRTLPEIDNLTSPIKLPGAAIHGSIIRYHNEHIESTTINHSIINDIAEYINMAVKDYPGLYVENKKIAFAIHYRKAKKFAKHAEEIAKKIHMSYPEIFSIQQGKCVFELKPRNVNKGLAVRKIMNTDFFRDKTPVYFGDDITDEAAFLEVNNMGGVSIKIGDGQTIACHRLSGVDEMISFLVQMSCNLK